MMTGHDVLRVLDGLHVNGVRPIVCGGWGVDALLGRQTRAHGDVDLIIGHEDVDQTLSILIALGYGPLRPLATGQMKGRQADGRTILLVCLDKDLSFQDGAERFRYNDTDLDGRGLIIGRPVRCLTAEAQVLVRSDFDLTQGVTSDLYLLADQLGAQLFYPLSRGDRVVCRRAEQKDIPAMAAVMADARRAAPVPHVDVTKSLKADTYARYWQQRLQLNGTDAHVVTIGDALAGTVATSPWQGSDLPTRSTAVLYGLVTHSGAPQFRAALVKRATDTARERGFHDLRTWLVAEDSTARTVFEQSGWHADGAHHEIVPGLTQIRYAAR